jgi:hypothetical protein
MHEGSILERRRQANLRVDAVLSRPFPISDGATRRDADVLAWIDVRVFCITWQPKWLAALSPTTTPLYKKCNHRVMMFL